MFITFEGGEGAGKSTQIQKLADHLTSLGKDVIVTREPGGTPDAEKIRDLLVSKHTANWDPVTDVLLLFAARKIHMQELILPSLRTGKIVLCDRFTDSTRVYQGDGLGVSPDVIESIKTTSIGAFEPDLTLVFDISPEQGLTRAHKRADETGEGDHKYEGFDMDFHWRLYNGYMELLSKYPERCRRVDATGDVISIAEAIFDIVTAYPESGCQAARS